MSVCLDCRWIPPKYNEAGHWECIKRNKGKVVKDCDCQHRVPQPNAPAGTAVLYASGDSGNAEGENADSDELAAGPGASTEGAEDKPDVESPGIIPASLLEDGVRQ